MTAELEVLRDAVARLDRAGVRYMLTGSIALSYYAEPRMTRDIDLVVELEARDAREVAALFGATSSSAAGSCACPDSTPGS